MASSLSRFMKIAKKSSELSLYAKEEVSTIILHPFDDRNIHPEISRVSKKLFDDGYYSHATFEAFKFIDRKVSKISRIRKSGVALMMQAFNEKSPVIKLTPLEDVSEEDEQKGYSFLFAGAVLAIRNPRGHEVDYHETLDQCLDHLTLGSLLFRKLSSRIENT